MEGSPLQLMNMQTTVLCEMERVFGGREHREPAESLENAQELVEGFHQENPDMPSRADVE